MASLVSQGPAKVRQRLEQADTDGARGRLGDGGFLRELEGAVGTAGRASAGVADRETLRGGRDLIDQASRQDRRVVGWARIEDHGRQPVCVLRHARPSGCRLHVPGHGGRRWPVRARGLPGRPGPREPAASGRPGGPDPRPRWVPLPDGPHLLTQ
ncbi:hypothetical protein GCM10010341_59800 [Streptomyces noursei]|nr:hypothetical protein GCM10010341_59800 [Streptomyces noursei]